METDTIKIDFIVPKGWHELTDAQLRYVYNLIALEMSSEEIAVTCLLHWSGTRVIGRQPDGAYLLQQKKQLFEVKPLAIVELAKEIDWLGQLPTYPIRLSAIRKATAIAADFQGVPFETFIICDNLYQGYLQTQQDDMLDELAKVLYPGLKKVSVAERISIFYWYASLKDYLSHRFSDFFQPLAGADSNLLGVPSVGSQLQEAMDAQIRALTKGDITKEAEILALDTWRALTELNAQAREYKQLQAQMKK